MLIILCFRSPLNPGMLQELQTDYCVLWCCNASYGVILCCLWNQQPRHMQRLADPVSLLQKVKSGTGSPDCTWIVPMTATSKSLVGPLFWTHTRVEGVKRLADWKQLKGTGLLGFETKKVFECQKEQLKKKRKKSWRMEKKSPVDLISNLFCFCFVC